MIAFYFGLALLLYTLIRNQKGRAFLSVLFVAALPVLIFAIFLFERDRALHASLPVLLHCPRISARLHLLART